MFKYAFFDLDGTLTQTEFGIINSINYALDKMGIQVTDRESVKRFIGPPLTAAFEDFYDMNDEDAAKATKIYREYYNAGEMYNAPLYDGVEKVLADLYEKGVKMYIVTSKPKVFAEKIADHFDVLKYFEKVVGPELSEKSYSKAFLVKTAMEDCGEIPSSEEERLKDYVMVGDRFYDIEGAVANSISSIGVLYGYGEREELEKAGATFIAETAPDITGIVLGE